MYNCRSVLPLDPHSILPAFLCLLLAVPALAGAQTSRRETLEEARAAKAGALEPYQPAALEKALLWVEDTRLLQRVFNPYEGWHPRFGGLTKGGGLGFGGGYRDWLWDERAQWDTFLVGSFRNYWFAGTGLTWPALAGDRLEVGAHAYFRYWPRERFFGLGRESLKGDRVGFLRESVELRGDLAYKPHPWLRVGGHTAVRAERLGRGSLPGYPSIEELFDEPEAPGLAVETDYLWSGAFVDVDYRDQPGNVRSGGHFRADYEHWQDQQSLGYSFRRVRGEALHAFPVFDRKRVFVLRAIGESTDSPAGNLVPFFQMPTVGGATTLRGYTEFRFRDRNMLLFNAEYRWEAFSGLDMALFADWGDVAPTWEALDIGKLKTTYGLGLRFNTMRSVFLRLDLGRSREGLRVVTSFSGAF